MREKFEICFNPDECLKRLKDDDKLAVAVSRLHAQNTPVVSQVFFFLNFCMFHARKNFIQIPTDFLC